MKKKLLLLSIILFSINTLSALDFQLRLLPHYSFASTDIYQNVFGGTLSADVIPVSFNNEKDALSFSLQGVFELLKVKDSPYSNTSLGADFAIGYSHRFFDRFGLSPEVYAGIYNIPELEVVYDNTGNAPDEKRVLSSMSGIVAGARLSADFYISPELQLSLWGGYKSYIYKPSFMNSIEVGLGVKYNFAKGLFNKPKVENIENNFEPLFPVFYSRYDNQVFGNANFINNEINDITDVKVSVYIPQYMAAPNVVAEYDVVKKGETFSADFTAFLNENIMNNLQGSKADARIIVTYNSLSKKMEYEQNVEISTLGRNSMTWADDRAASAFVSGRDASALQFARQIASVVKKELDPDVPRNIQYAAAIFCGLKLYGINYVVDPSSAFSDNIGTLSVDFLQFPYQSLLYHGGDCDDLSILNCSLLEALGIDTAFITVPGHIYMAFDSGVAPADADKYLMNGRFLQIDDKLWIPVEITLSQDTFNLAWYYGINEWKKNEDEANLLPLHNCWSEYETVSVPESEIAIEMPDAEEIRKMFRETMTVLKGKYVR